LNGQGLKVHNRKHRTFVNIKKIIAGEL